MPKKPKLTNFSSMLSPVKKVNSKAKKQLSDTEVEGNLVDGKLVSVRINRYLLPYEYQSKTEIVKRLRPGIKKVIWTIDPDKIETLGIIEYE